MLQLDAEIICRNARKLDCWHSTNRILKRELYYITL